VTLEDAVAAYGARRMWFVSYKDGADDLWLDDEGEWGEFDSETAAYLTPAEAQEIAVIFDGSIRSADVAPSGETIH
jgi:hypothetical protein